MGREFDIELRPASAPVPYIAGTEKKILAMQARIQNGESCFHERDGLTVEYLDERPTYLLGRMVQRMWFSD